MDKNEGTLIACMPVTGVTVPHVPSDVDVCTVCSTKVWIAKTSRKIAQETGAKIVCFPCMVIGFTKDSEIAMPTKEQITEIRDHIKKQHREN